jgi:hypothetical protein
VLPESKPDIWLDDAGVCNLCRAAEAAASRPAERDLLETDFVKILKQHQGRGAYDCLVMCSGGKDSTSSLYYMVKRYKQRVLAFTFDHGFETEDALDNVRRAVEALGVDFLFFRSTYMRNMFANIVRSGSRAVLCHPCSIWYMQLAFDVAARYDIPMIIAGWTKGQSTRQDVMSKCACSISSPEFAAMGKATAEFLASLKDDPQYRDFPRSMEEALTRAKKRHKCLVLSPHWFLNSEPEEYVALISRELKWRYPRLSYPAKTTNCYLNFLSVHRTIKDFGYSHYHAEASRLIRLGLLSRAEALEMLAINFDQALLDRVGAMLGAAID